MPALNEESEWEYVYEDQLEEGDEWEYLDASEEDSNPLSYRKVQSVTDDLNAVYRDGVSAIREIKGTLDEIKGMFGFGGIFK